MKNFFKINILMVVWLLLIACGLTSQTTTSFDSSPTQSSIPTVTLSINQTSTVPVVSTPTQFDVMSIPLPTLVIPDGTNIPFPTPNPSVPTLLPTIDPKLVPELLRNSITIQTLKGVNGHTIQRITGWNYGFRQKPCHSYQWL